jgi:hypothetical protein
LVWVTFNVRKSQVIRLATGKQVKTQASNPQHSTKYRKDKLADSG